MPAPTTQPRADMAVSASGVQLAVNAGGVARGKNRLRNCTKRSKQVQTPGSINGRRLKKKKVTGLVAQMLITYHSLRFLLSDTRRAVRYHATGRTHCGVVVMPRPEERATLGIRRKKGKGGESQKLKVQPLLVTQRGIACLQ